MNYIFSNKKKFQKSLIPLFFIGSPFLFGGIISCFFEYFIDFKWLMAFVTFSSWFFSFFSILLIFIVWEKFRDSTYLKNIRDKEYLDMEGVKDLKSAVSKVRSVVDGEIDIDQLHKSCRAIKYIHDKLDKQKRDTQLYPLKNEIDDVFSVINEFNLESIGRKNDSEKWQEIPSDNKEYIGKKTYTLEMELERLLKDLR